MRKIYLLTFLSALFFTPAVKAQQAYIKAPALQTTTTNIKAPNGTSNHVTFRGCYILTASELSTIGTNTAVNAIGFFLNSGASPAVTGTIQLYLQNTSDVTYNKGTNYNTAIAPMTSVYNSTMVIPAGTSTITLPFPTNFTYTGGGLYVGMDWVTTGPFSAGAAVYQADNTLATGGAAVSTTVIPASTLMVTNSVRPVFRIGYVNTYTNEAQAYGVYGNGRQPLINGAPYSFSVLVRNNAGVTMNNIVPTLSITGANPFTATTNIVSIPAGGTIVAAFPGYTPTTQGMSTVNVIMPNDENNTNNIATMQQSATCNYWSSAPPVPIANFNQGVGFSTGSGILLNKMRVAQTSTLNALRLGIANYNPNSGNQVYGVVTNAGGSILATTNTITITNAMFSTWQPFTFPSGVPINANTDYYIGMAQIQNSVTPYFPLAAMPTVSNNIPASLYATSILGGGLIFAQTPTLGVFAVEGVFHNGISLTVTPQTSTICSGNSLTISASGATSYSWSNGASTSSINVTPGVYTAYTCTGSAIVGTVGACEDIKTAQVYVNLTPTITCPNGAICPVGGSFTMVPGGAATYTFAGGGPVVTPSVTTSYTVTGTSGAGCPAANTVVTTVSVSNSPTVAIAGPTMICLGASPILTGSGAISYSWSTGSTFSSVIVSPGVTSTYTLFGYYGTCTTSAMLTISVSPNPTLSAQTSNTLLCIGSTATLSAFGANSYSWSTGQTGLTATVSPSVETTYTLTGNINGICEQSVAITQSVISCVGIAENNTIALELKIFPNPNNGAFTVLVSSLTESSSIQILNSLGQVILTESLKDTSTELNLKNLPKGVYFVKLRESESAVKTSRIIIQ